MSHVPMLRIAGHNFVRNRSGKACISRSSCAKLQLERLRQRPTWWNLQSFVLKNFFRVVCSLPASDPGASSSTCICSACLCTPSLAMVSEAFEGEGVEGISTLSEGGCGNGKPNGRATRWACMLPLSFDGILPSLAPEPKRPRAPAVAAGARRAASGRAPVGSALTFGGSGTAESSSTACAKLQSPRLRHLPIKWKEHIFVLWNLLLAEPSLEALSVEVVGAMSTCLLLSLETSTSTWFTCSSMLDGVKGCCMPPALKSASPKCI
mmetsp:Transcript_163703/g.525009  ORF Transcript_163703/g.525009 Transcript_163703/m.525009 type:complete len:265 (-) Transcript_163703:662-1456(-)